MIPKLVLVSCFGEARAWPLHANPPKRGLYYRERRKSIKSLPRQPFNNAVRRNKYRNLPTRAVQPNSKTTEGRIHSNAILVLCLELEQAQSLRPPAGAGSWARRLGDLLQGH